DGLSVAGLRAARTLLPAFDRPIRFSALIRSLTTIWCCHDFLRLGQGMPPVANRNSGRFGRIMQDSLAAQGAIIPRSARPARGADAAGRTRDSGLRLCSRV